MHIHSYTHIATDRSQIIAHHDVTHRGSIHEYELNAFIHICSCSLLTLVFISIWCCICMCMLLMLSIYVVRVYVCICLLFLCLYVISHCALCSSFSWYELEAWSHVFRLSNSFSFVHSIIISLFIVNDCKTGSTCRGNMEKNCWND